MTHIITKGTPADYDDIIDFANYVFGIDFPSLLPKLYQGHEECALHHHLVKEGHRVKAMVGSFPLELKVLQHTLRVYGIGTVSVHRYARGSGYMKLLMDNAVEEMKTLGCDLAVLGGQRQRYEYWGFTPCGFAADLDFNQANIKHGRIADPNRYVFEEYTEQKQTDLHQAIHLHDSQSVHAQRAMDRFIEISRSWDSRIYFIYRSGVFAGYACTSREHDRVNELLLSHPEEADQTVAAYMKQFSVKNMSLVLQTHRLKEFALLSRLCERCTLHTSANMLILNYPRVLRAFMELKNSLFPLQEGILVLRIEDIGVYRMEVKSGEVSVEETDAPHDLALSHLDASSRLFSPEGFLLGPDSHPLMKAWFPLPLFFPIQDNV